jgi:hypothetical protein
MSSHFLSLSLSLSLSHTHTHTQCDHHEPAHIQPRKGKVLPQEAELSQGVPGRLRPRIFLTFGTTRVVCRQPYAPATFSPGEIPGTNF